MDPNSLIFNENAPNFVHRCGYKLLITEQNLAQKGLAQAKIVLKIFFFFGGGGGGTFLTHPVYAE